MLAIPLLLRVARQLERIWAGRSEPWSEPDRTWAALESHLAGAAAIRRRLRLALARNLSQAAATLKQELNGTLRSAALRIEELRTTYGDENRRMPDRCEWVKELRHLEAEFGAVEVRWADTVIRVVTDPIVLHGIRLGPFAIEFDWTCDRRSTRARSFRIKALKPNPPSGRDDVTHPHVQDEILCAGDANDSLDEAVAAGRLVDAFLLVQSVLATYNANSPYVRLDEWDGLLCAECGRRVGSSETQSCEGCDCTLCDECGDRCEGCSETRCGDCLSPCDVCLARHCRG
ncbi:MAG TPA: hypothetical protein VHR72_01015, partial [Gemmataceae bacterium]|nr:hypothetical protein [Gemmataceae bacterium]